MTQPEGIYGFSEEFRFLSNFYPCEVEFDGLIYRSVEHAYQAAKTLDLEQRAQIQNLRTAGQAKRAGRTVTMRADWLAVREGIMYQLLVQKFADTLLRQMLCATDDLYIEETNTWGDTFWGVCKGQGQNILGCQLMQIRNMCLQQ